MKMMNKSMKEKKGEKWMVTMSAWFDWGMEKPGEWGVVESAENFEW